MKLITGNNFSSGTEGKIIWKILVGHYGINYMRSLSTWDVVPVCGDRRPITTQQM